MNPQGSKMQHVIEKCLGDRSIEDIIDIYGNANTFTPCPSKLLEEIVRSLNHDRNINSGWVNVGMALYTFGTVGLTLWKEFIKDTRSNYDIFCEIKIFNADPKLKNLKSIYLHMCRLLYWLKIDNGQEFTRIATQYVNDINMMGINVQNIDSVELKRLYKLGNDGYVQIYFNYYMGTLRYDIARLRSFYQYNCENQLWERRTNKYIQHHFSSNIHVLIEPLIEHYSRKLATCKNSMKCAYYTKYIKSINKSREFHKAPATVLDQLLPSIISKFSDGKFCYQLNTSSDFLPVKSGVLNLRTGEYRKRLNTDYFTFELSTEWKGLNYDTKDIDLFMNDIMLGNDRMIQYLQCVLGYSISGYTNNKLLVIWYGNGNGDRIGSNGKKILQELLTTLLYRYCERLTKNIILKDDEMNAIFAHPHISGLIEARLGFINDVCETDDIDNSIIEKIVNGRSIETQFLAEKYKSIVVKPLTQLVLLTNDYPEINIDRSKDIHIVSIPFPAIFKDKEKYNKKNKFHKIANPNIKNELLQKLDQLLVWLVKGSIKYFADGLPQMPNGNNVSTGFLNDTDLIGNFINEKCALGPQKFVYHSTLLDEYKQFSGIQINHIIFTRSMRGKGFTTTRRNKGMGFVGLSLK